MSVGMGGRGGCGGCGGGSGDGAAVVGNRSNAMFVGMGGNGGGCGGGGGGGCKGSGALVAADAVAFTKKNEHSWIQFSRMLVDHHQPEVTSVVSDSHNCGGG